MIPVTFVYNFWFTTFCDVCLYFQVHYILSELVMGGMVLETNMTEILTRIEEQNKLEKQEVSYEWMDGRTDE